MREIKFRGRRKDNGRWAYGYFIKTPITTEFNCDGQFLDSGVGRYCIVQDGCAHEVDPETVGQYTGIEDKDATEIYKGDTLKDGPWVGVVRWLQEHCAFVVESEGSFYPLENGDAGFRLRNTKVIGNIHDNPELAPAPASGGI